jgi:hypothetical protein
MDVIWMFMTGFQEATKAISLNDGKLSVSLIAIGTLPSFSDEELQEPSAPRLRRSIRGTRFRALSAERPKSPSQERMSSCFPAVRRHRMGPARCAEHARLYSE